mmetsp:Transcript_37278/g.118640  ORF Transcript_37278/g.118640 Transcript_37278/m.118640 type:complete len:222 (-) Transcript_37278:477-1142(-)
MRSTRCTPESVDTSSDSSPTSRAKAASEKGFCIFSRANGPRSPPFLAELQSECARASSSNFRRREPQPLGPPSGASCSRKPARKAAASSRLQVIAGWRQEEGRRQSRCFRRMCKARISRGSFLARLALGAGTASWPSSPQALTVTFCVGLPSAVPQASITRSTSMPSTTWPKTTCLPSRCGVAFVQMKNCEPLVFGPELAMDRTPGPVWRNLKFSSAKVLP